jgi:AsmA protein
VGVKLMPLLSKKIEVEEITLRDPLIIVIKNRKGEMNLSTLGPKTPATSSTERPEAPSQPAGNPLQVLALLVVDRVSITGGTITYRDESTTNPTEYQVNNLEVLLKSVHLGETPTLHLAATVQPYNIPVKLDGSFGPLVETLDLKQFGFDLGLGKIAMALKGSVVGGNLDATLTSPLINSADVPVTLPLEKPVIVKNFRLTARPDPRCRRESHHCGTRGLDRPWTRCRDGERHTERQRHCGRWARQGQHHVPNHQHG